MTVPADWDPLKPIAVIGSYPPPINGYAVITSSVEALLRERRRTFRLDISPGTSRRGLFYHATRIFRVAQTAARLIGLRWSVGPFDTYIATESRIGLIYTIALAALARVLGSRIYLHHHVFRYVDRHSRLMEVLLFATGKSATHIFLCRCMRKAFVERYKSPITSAIVSNVAFADTPSDELPRKWNGPLTVGLLSNLTREKGLYEFLELAEGAVRSDLPMRFVLAGPTDAGEDAEAISRAVKQMAPSLTYLGPVFDQEKSRFYRDIDVFVFPTTYANEAQPMVVFEALSNGCETIAFDRGCIAEQVGDRGWVIPRSSSFVEAASALLQDIMQDAAPRDAAKENVKRSMKAESLAAREAFTELLARPGARSAELASTTAKIQ